MAMSKYEVTGEQNREPRHFLKEAECITHHHHHHHHHLPYFTAV